MAASNFPTLVDEKDAATRLGLSRRTLQAWRVSGGGPRFVKLGRRVAYAVDDLAAFVNAGRRAHTSGGAQ